MCGIMGYVGKKPCVDLIYDGLKKLEYRGYDSAGIAVLSNGHVELVKSEGKLVNLAARLKELPTNVYTGMGHTRWATHGPPTRDNAHPHALPHVAIIHNGIIENYMELKAHLQSKGVRFASQTDTEVVLHILDEKLKEHADPKKAILSMLGHLKGAYALTIMIAREPHSLYVVKQGSPGVIGLGKDENYFASDALALLAHTNRMMFLNDGEMAHMTPEGVKVFDFEGRPVERAAAQLDWSPASIEKAGYRHFMLKEIHEQPIVIANTISRFVNKHSRTIDSDALGLSSIDLKKVDHVIIVACGSAYHAGVTARYAMEIYMGVPVAVELASEFRYRHPFLRPSTLIVAVSQSGETIDTLEGVKHAASKGCQVFTVCNVRFSAIPRASTSTLLMEAGPEIGVASTKAFTSQILCLYMVALAAGKLRGTIDQQVYDDAIDSLNLLPPLVEKAVSASSRIEELAAKYYESTSCLFIGRGPSSAIALEGALKLKEISYIHAEGYAGGELKHGPIALIDKHLPVVAVAPQDSYHAKMLSNIEEIRAREGLIIGVGAEGDKSLQSLSADYMPCPQSDDETLQAILSTVPLQLFAYHVAVKRGTDVDQPRNLAKSVTVE